MRAGSLTGGTLHVVVNNAGVIAPAMFAKMTAEQFQLVLDVHVGGTFTVSQAALPFLAVDGTGRIINVTSAAGLVGTIGQVNYGAAKAAVVGLTKSLATQGRGAVGEALPYAVMTTFTRSPSSYRDGRLAHVEMEATTGKMVVRLGA